MLFVRWEKFMYGAAEIPKFFDGPPSLLFYFQWSPLLNIYEHGVFNRRFARAACLGVNGVPRMCSTDHATFPQKPSSDAFCQT